MELHDLWRLIKRAGKRMMNQAIAGAFERWTEAGLTLVHFSARRQHFLWTTDLHVRLDVSTFCGLCSEVVLAKTSEVELRSGRLL